MESLSRSNSMEANALRVKVKQKRNAAEDTKRLTEEAVMKKKLCGMNSTLSEQTPEIC